MLNDGGTNGFLTVNLIQPAPNKRGIGARIEVWQNGKVQLRDITAGDGFTSQNMDFSAHFGLGTASSVDSLIIKWPDRKRDKLTNVQANQHLSIQKGGTINQPPSKFEIIQIPMIANAGKAEANFFWEPSIDPEGNVVKYIVTVKNSEGEIVYESPSIETPFFKAEFDIDRANFEYSWVVTATDGLHVRRSLNVSSLLQVTGDAIEDGQLPERLHISSLFPNPVSGSANLVLHKPSPGNLTIEVLDMLGRVVIQNRWAYEASGSDVYRLDLTVLAPGAYAIRVQMGSQVHSKTMVKVQ
ncbi:MAG: ASPIC/UnbV domain-containing protein [Bacteroidetes bacterium]|nr:ASPIC/UnbV domain-containing protein [Bacteroidota bacterium]